MNWGEFLIEADSPPENLDFVLTAPDAFGSYVIQIDTLSSNGINLSDRMELMVGHQLYMPSIQR